MAFPKYSVIIPVFNEADSLPGLLKEVARVFARMEAEWEAIFVDDGSTDNTLDVLGQLAAEEPCIRVLSFGRNLGKSAAYTAGFRHARAATIITMDGDLQDDPAELPKLLARMKKGYDLVIGWKQGRGRNEPGKTVPSRLYNSVKALLFGVRFHDSNCGYRVMTREVADSLNLYGDRYRFIPELAHLKGFRVAESPVRHRPRRYGQSKFGMMRFYTGLLDLISVRFLVGYGVKPLHFFGFVAFFPMTAGILLELYVLAMKLGGSLFRTHMAALVVGVMLILIGFQLLSIGLVCEMIAAHRPNPTPPIRRRIGFESGKDENPA